MAQFKFLSEEKVFQAHAFDVVKLHYELPDGRTRSYDLVDHLDAVTIVPINQEGEVLFVKQYRVGAQDYLLELPAGLLDEGEDPVETAMRELREETGMAAKELVKIGGFYMTPGYSNEFMTVFLATDLYPAPLEMDDDEFLNLIKIPLKEAYEKARNGEIQDGKSITSLFLAMASVVGFDIN
jgi:ADP-ribose pyrophosphatase